MIFKKKKPKLNLPVTLSLTANLQTSAGRRKVCETVDSVNGEIVWIEKLGKNEWAVFIRRLGILGL